MTSDNDSLLDLERYRSQLEDNVAKLRASLRHWQTWEFEYEGMQEEIGKLGPKDTSTELVSNSKIHVVSTTLTDTMYRQL